MLRGTLTYPVGRRDEVTFLKIKNVDWCSITGISHKDEKSPINNYCSCKPKNGVPV